MTYSEAISYLFNVAPLFQHIGAGAYKEGLENTRALDARFGHPHTAYPTIHVAGTNGKGSVSHTLAAILQSAGLRVGLYTSPHLVDFRERIRVNGEMIPEQRVIDFIEQERSFFEPLHPSFFELATALAFQYFKEQKVDIAVIEVGLGGRLDCTNIISPILSVITNISFDHTQFLGHTLPEIAREKAGIIKPGVPVVIGETNGHAEVREVFLETARAASSPIVFADEEDEIIRWNDGRCTTRNFGSFETELRGLCQKKNTATLLAAVKHIKDAVKLTTEDIHNGFAHVCPLTGLMGRWQCVRQRPTVICDTGHNAGGLAYIAEQLSALGKQSTIRIVLGMVSDKDIRAGLSLLPREAVYYFTQASVKRAMPADDIAALGREIGLQASPGGPVSYPTVAAAYEAALSDAADEELIFVGGSTFIVADLLAYLRQEQTAV
ncbi:MAG: bifunctional folylpolyglutamate synthase/dihydrofolate synthase [Bacteroidaceae bacterium]|nr:bifunctional folylpolyglutamate synthase/dihydrofolate synthase [Bacteroidaceae bacterium]